MNDTDYVSDTSYRLALLAKYAREHASPWARLWAWLRGLRTWRS